MLALAVPIAAWGALVGYSGHVVDQELAEIDFDVVRKQGDNKRVRNFELSQIEASCGGGPPEPIGGLVIDSMRVNQRNRFKGSTEDDDEPPSTMRVTGRIVNQGKAARGTVRATDIFENSNGEEQLCDSGQVDWTARRN